MERRHEPEPVLEAQPGRASTQAGFSGLGEGFAGLFCDRFPEPASRRLVAAWSWL